MRADKAKETRAFYPGYSGDRNLLSEKQPFR
jgi:hypothetical protein